MGVDYEEFLRSKDQDLRDVIRESKLNQRKLSPARQRRDDIDIDEYEIVREIIKRKNVMKS